MNATPPVLPYPPSKHYPLAPITEAVIELRCELQENDITKIANDIAGVVRESYRRTEELYEWRGEFGQAGSRLDPPKVAGYKFVNNDERHVFLAKLDAFAFSELPPYDEWARFRDAARAAWEIYERAASPRRIYRVGVRFVNRVDVPAPAGESIDLDAYFNTAPRIAPQMPQGMTNYFMRLQIPLPEPGMLAIVTETGVPPPAEGLVSTVLDIDVIVERTSLTESEAWETIERLRYHKNGIFESSITDKVRSLIS